MVGPSLLFADEELFEDDGNEVVWILIVSEVMEVTLEVMEGSEVTVGGVFDVVIVDVEPVVFADVVVQSFEHLFFC